MKKSLFIINPDGSNEGMAREMAQDVVNLILRHFSQLEKKTVYEKPAEDFYTSQIRSTGNAWANVVNTMEQVLQNSMQVAHPRFFGHMDSGPLYVSVLADFVVAALNQNMLSAELSPYASVIEVNVIDWLTGLFGLKEGEGTFVSGGTLANLTGLLLALNHATDGRFREQGAWAFSKKPVIFTSDQAHYSIKKAAASTGLGENCVIPIRTDTSYRMDSCALEQAIDQAIESNQQPVMVVATAGTTSTGSIDPLSTLADICNKHHLWYHVDAAHGGTVAFSTKARWKMSGIERADSITFDPHKWLMQSKGMGIILTRHKGMMQNVFQADAPYLEREKLSVNQNRGSQTLQGSRRFDALRLWLTKLYLGDEGLREMVDHNLDQVKNWLEILQSTGHFELAHHPDLNLLCFRFHDQGLTPLKHNELNAHIQQQLMDSGKGFVSLTTLSGVRWMRSVFINPSTKRSDMEEVVMQMESIAAKWFQS